MLNKLDKAARLLIESVEYDPTDENALRNGVTGYLLQGDRARARELAQQLLRRSPDAPTSYAALADSAADNEPFEILAARVPEHLRGDEAVAYSLGQLARRRGLHQQAVDALRSAAATPRTARSGSARRDRRRQDHRP
jgi:tetratricopeptide (TPR) repeat protein